jgi:hypothetical protein
MSRREGPLPVRATVPGGVWRDGRRELEVPLRPISAEDEAFLLVESAAGTLPSEMATALLGRCIAGPDGAEVASGLSIGDREALLLQLRRITLGDGMECVIGCHVCGERMELTLRASDLLLPPYDALEAAYELSLPTEEGTYEIRFRVPAATDLDRAARLARRDPAEGENELLRRCVLHVERAGTDVTSETLPPNVRAAVAREMTARDPQAELGLDLRCPSCSAELSVVLDTATFLLQELEDKAERLLQEVHTLALRYHWSEADILAMSPQRRGRYLELVIGSGASR